MMKQFFVWFLLIFIGQFSLSNAQSNTQVYSSSSDSIESIRIRDIVLHGNVLLAKQKYDSAIIIYTFADSLAAEIENDRLQASSKHNIGFCYFKMGEYLESKVFFEDAIVLSEREEDEINLAHYLISMGVLYKKQGVYSKSLEYIMKSLVISDKHNDSALMASAYNAMAGIQKTLGNYKEAIQYYNDALKIYMKNGEQANIAKVYNNIGNVFQVMDSVEISKVYYHKSLNEKKKIKAKRSKITSLKNLGESCSKLGQLDSAQYYYLQALEVSAKINHKGKIAFCLNAIGELKTKIKQYDSASFYLGKARIISADYQLKKTLLDNYRFSKNLFGETKQYQKAFRYSELYNILNNELYNQEKTKGMNELRFKYETDKKDNMIIALNEINDLKNRSIIFISIALILILLLSVGLSMAYKQKKNAHAYIQLLMQESRHRTKNNLQLLSSILSLHSDQVSIEHRDAVMSAEYRVQSIVLLNKQLDLDDTKGRISLSDYFESLTEGLLDAYTTKNHIDLRVSITDIEVLPHQATHLGLIVNELFTNSLKYAFDGILHPTIKMDCSLIAMGKCKLIISDNGKGLPLNWETKAESSLGLNLVKDLSEQLRGELTLENRTGFFFQLIFQLK